MLIINRNSPAGINKQNKYFMFPSQTKLYKNTKLSACRTIFSVSRKYLYSNKSE
jgi:hypothetical protein